MGLAEQMADLAAQWAKPLGVTAGVAVGLGLASRLMFRKHATAERRLPRQVAMMVLTLMGLIAIFASADLEPETRGQILSLVGLAFTAVIALSSTTFVANIMGGLMVRAVRSFRPGDFIQIGGHFGRVTERGLFHTELQTEDRDLVTLPNLYVVTNPVKVVRASGTVVSATLSLGYDVSRKAIAEQLKLAAEDAGLEGAFVHVLELGDFSVTYKVAGFLGDTESLLTTRSRLRCAALDRLHGAGIEIVSPTFMNQRPLNPDNPILPPSSGPTAGMGAGEEPDEDDSHAESVAFDKASKASVLEALRDQEAETVRALAAEPSDIDRIALERRLENLKGRIARFMEDLSER